MKRTAGICLLVISSFCSFAQTYTLNWASSFSPAWSNGATTGHATNIGGSGINASVTTTSNGGTYTSIGGTSTPTVTGSVLSVPGSSANLEIGIDFPHHGDHVQSLIQFSAPVSHVRFVIADIDKISSTGTGYIDEITVSGSDGTVTHFPTLTKYDATTDPNFLVISGNTVGASSVAGHGGNTASNATDQRGAVIVDFGSNLITTVTIHFKNEPNAQNDPDAQEVAFGNLSFQKPLAVPVTFTYVRAVPHQQQTVIEWQTASETSNKYFEVQRNVNSRGWETIGRVEGAGNDFGLKTYSFSDPKVRSEIHHYRVKQIDFDGKFSYSVIVSITHTQKHFTGDIYPNPVQSSSIITLYVDKAEEVVLTITDATSKTVLRDVWPANKGTNELSLPMLGKLKKGHYYLHLRSANTNHSKTIKFLVL